MGALIFEIVHGPSLILLGHVRLADTSQLTASAPTQGHFDVLSTTGEKLALLYIALRFESLSAAYSELSSSIPTIDMEIDPQRRAVDESDVHPTPPPPSLNPATPITHPRQTAQDMDPFVSPVVKGVQFALTSPERLEYTAEYSQISTPTTNKKEVEKEITEGIGEIGGTARSQLTTLNSPRHYYQGANGSSDLIGALLQRGEKLREAMVMSADEDNDVDEPGGMGSVMERNSPPGKLFKAILTSDEPGVDDSVAIESVFLHNNKAVDLVLGEEKMHYLEESSDTSAESSIVSESGDPLYDETLLKDLFYTTPAVQSDTDSENTVITDDDDEETVTHTSQEEKYKLSVKAGHKHSSAQTTSKKNSTRIDKTVKHVDLSERTDALSEVTSMGYLDPKHSSTDDTTEGLRDQHSPSHNSSDSLTSTIKSKKQSPNPRDFIENLGPEKLTALGRVDAARVMVDSLGITGENIKPGTYFVEYNFPTSTPAHGRDKDITMATELTRIASKKNPRWRIVIQPSLSVSSVI
ncbi:hypothetical protein ACROYT_G019358 [Oculina patagonica]